MRKPNCRWLLIVLAMVVSIGMAACSAEPRENAVAAGESDIALETAGEDESPEGQAERSSLEGEGEHGENEGEGEHGGSEGEGEESGTEGEGEHGGSEGEGEHDEGGEEGEESGVYVGLEDTWDATRNGARLVLSFDPASNAFVGTVENTTRQTLCGVRVEVHLSTGIELGPTERIDLPSGETTVLRLPTEGENFDTWTAHPEISSCTGV